jgi:hypothetical protein
MTALDAIAFFNEAHVLVMHTNTAPLRAYAVWIEHRYIEAASYLELAVECKKLYDELAAQGKLPPLKPEPAPYAGAEGMNVRWRKDETKP